MKIIRPGERKAALNDTFVVVVFCAFASMSILLLTNIASMKTVESDTMKNKDQMMEDNFQLKFGIFA